MRKLFILILLLIITGLVWFLLPDRQDDHAGNTPEYIAVKSHSESFNMAVDKAIAAYLLTKDALVESDTSAARMHGARFLATLDSIPMDELKADSSAIYSGAVSALSDIKANMNSMLSQNDITEMRKDFSNATGMMYPGFFKMIHYEGPKLYLQHCPMAFDGNTGADWISDKPMIMNPYLGRNHPEYKSAMLHCGEIKDSITATP